MSVWTKEVSLGSESTPDQLEKTKNALNAIYPILWCMPAPGSPDYKPDDSSYQALRAEASRTLEAFLRLLRTPDVLAMGFSVFLTLNVLQTHGEASGLLTSPLIREIYGYLDAYKKAHGQLSYALQLKEEWIRNLYHNLKPDSSEQVCCFHSSRMNTL